MDNKVTYDNIPSRYGFDIGEDITKDLHKKVLTALSRTIDEVAEAAYRMGRDDARKEFGQWIPVEDGLPEVGTEVLVFAKGKTEGFDSVIAIASRHIYKFFSWSEGEEMWSTPWEYFHTNYEITHWMPFPEIPAEEDDAPEEDTDD